MKTLLLNHPHANAFGELMKAFNPLGTKMRRIITSSVQGEVSWSALLHVLTLFEPGSGNKTRTENQPHYHQCSSIDSGFYHALLREKSRARNEGGCGYGECIEEICARNLHQLRTIHRETVPYPKSSGADTPLLHCRCCLYSQILKQSYR